MLRAELRSSPRVELEEGRAALKLFLTVHIGAGSPDFQSFLSVSAVSERCRTGPLLLLPSTAAAGTVPSGIGLCCNEQGARSVLQGAVHRWLHHISMFRAERGQFAHSDPAHPVFLAGRDCRTAPQRHRHTDDDLRSSDRVTSPAVLCSLAGDTAQSLHGMGKANSLGNFLPLMAWPLWR